MSKIIDLEERRFSKFCEKRLEQLAQNGLCVYCEKPAAGFPDSWAPDDRSYFLCRQCAYENPENCEGLCSVCGRDESSYPARCNPPRGWKCPQESDKEYRRIMFLAENPQRRGKLVDV